MSAELDGTFTVGIATPIQSDPELFNAVRKATEYFEKSIKDHKLDPAKRELSWGCSDESQPSDIIPSLSESDRYGSRHASRLISRKRMLDHVSRELTINDLVLDILRQRWYQVGKIIDQGIRELERAEERNAESH